MFVLECDYSLTIHTYAHEYVLYCMYTSPCILCLQSLYSCDVLDNLTEDDVRVLMETEDEVSMFVCLYIICMRMYCTYVRTMLRSLPLQHVLRYGI